MPRLKFYNTTTNEWEGVGIRGESGRDYILTEADKNDIAELASELLENETSGNSVLCVKVENNSLGVLTVSHTNSEIQNAYHEGKEIICHYKDMDMTQSLRLVHCTAHQCTFTACGPLGDWKIVIDENVPAVEMTYNDYVDQEMLFSAMQEVAEAFNQFEENYQRKGNYITDEGAEEILKDYVKKDDFQVGEALKLENGILSVNTTDSVEQDNTLPITSAGVFSAVGNIEALLKTI